MKQNRQTDMVRQVLASLLYDAMVQEDLVPGELALMSGVPEKRIRAMLRAEHKNSGDATLSEVVTLFMSMGKTLDISFTSATTFSVQQRPTEIGGQLNMLDRIRDGEFDAH